MTHRHIATPGILALAIVMEIAPLRAQTPSWHLLPAPITTATQALAYDPERKRMVRVDSSGWHGGFDTWEWIDGTWSLRKTATTPPPRGDFAMAYNPINQRVLLVGGRTVFLYGQPGTLLNDTWEYDGIDWVQRTPLIEPQPHAGLARTVTSCGSAGLWQWDGSNWTQLAAGPGTPWTASEDAHVVYDESSNELVQVAWVGGTMHTATWNNGWNLVTSTTGPTPRADYGLTFDHARQRLAMFGGNDPSTSIPTYFNELWEWNGSAWLQRNVPNPPTPRSDVGFVYDHANGQLLSIGEVRHLVPWTPSPLAETWALDSRPNAAEQNLGPGCGGAFTPVLVAGATYPGAEVVAFELHHAPPSTPSMFGFGIASGTVPVGAGCTQYLANQDQLWLTYTNATGVATTTASIPLMLHGFSFAVQGAVLDMSNPLGVSLSAGREFAIGHE